MFGKVRDPVCSMKIKKTDAVVTSQREGKTYYFCSQECKDKFKKNPKKYI